MFVFLGNLDSHALSTHGWIAVQFPGPLYFVGAFGPLLAALILSFYAEGLAVRSLLSGLWKWRVPLRYYLCAIGIPLAAYAVSALCVVLGYGDTFKFQLTPGTAILAAFGTMLVITAGEEMGWRGFALSLMQNHYTPFRSSWVLWLMWSIWHLPAIFVSGLFDTLPQIILAFLAFMLLLLPVTFIFTWLFNASRGSTWLAVVLHAAVAAVSGISNAAMQKPVLFFGIFSLCFFVIAVLVWRWGPVKLFSTPLPQ